jgi:hypothetical protein
VVHRLDGRLGVGDADVHVAAEHHLLAEGLPVVLGQVPVAGLVGRHLVPPVRERVGAGGGQAQALPHGRLDQRPPAVPDRVADLAQGGADGRVHLHLGAVQLGLDVVAQLGLGLGQDQPGDRAQLAGRRVDELVLLLDPDAERLAQPPRPRSRSTNCR